MLTIADYDGWLNSLKNWSAPHDLTTEEGRAGFRSDVLLYTHLTHFETIYAVTRLLGVKTVPNTKAGALRTMADIFIIRQLVALKGLPAAQRAMQDA